MAATVSGEGRRGRRIESKAVVRDDRKGRRRDAVPRTLPRTGKRASATTQVRRPNPRMRQQDREEPGVELQRVVPPSPTKPHVEVGDSGVTCVHSARDVAAFDGLATRMFVAPRRIQPQTRGLNPDALPIDWESISGSIGDPPSHQTGTRLQPVSPPPPDSNPSRSSSSCSRSRPDASIRWNRSRWRKRWQLRPQLRVSRRIHLRANVDVACCKRRQRSSWPCRTTTCTRRSEAGSTRCVAVGTRNATCLELLTDLAKRISWCRWCTKAGRKIPSNTSR